MSRIPLPLLTNADAFYQERDSRSHSAGSAPGTGSKRIAIVVPKSAFPYAVGLETALFWTASILRRMGRRFASLILVAPEEFRKSDSKLATMPGISVEDLISTELRGADPFADFEWRTPTGTVEVPGADEILWLGTLPLAAPSNRVIALSASGWTAAVHQNPGPNVELIGAEFDAAPAAIIFAACMATAKIFSNGSSIQDNSLTLGFALDSGMTSTNQSVYSEWLARGGSLATIAPWNSQQGNVPTINKLLVVSAGGIGGNFCRIMGSSFVSVGSAYVVEPDSFEISNLNRAIGVSVEMAMMGLPKAQFGSEWLRRCSKDVTAVKGDYESWINPEIAAEFRNENTAVIVGVDQVRTRLNVGSDWPFLLINGATAGGGFSTSLHLRTEGGCLGCWYGQSEATFNATRTPMACAAGVATAPVAASPVSSYPFVSVATAALIVATLIRSAVLGTKGFSGTLTRMSLRSPENAELQRIEISDRCLLLCFEPYLQSKLGRIAAP